MRETVALLALSCLSCGEEGDPVPPPGDDCGFEADSSFVFSAVALDTDDSVDSCPEVTPSDVNGAEEPECTRSLQGCVLVLNCSFEALEGLVIDGRGRLELGDGSSELVGTLRVESPLACTYRVRARLE